MTASILSFPDPEKRYGACPTCNCVGGYVTIGSVYFLTCAKHRLFWCAGENLPWPRTGDSPEDWSASVATLAEFTKATPVRPFVDRRGKAA